MWSVCEVKYLLHIKDNLYKYINNNIKISKLVVIVKSNGGLTMWTISNKTNCQDFYFLILHVYRDVGHQIKLVLRRLMKSS